MIALLAGLVLFANPVSERVDPDARIATVQAVIQLPPLSKKSYDLMRAYGKCLGRETSTYSEAQILEVNGRVGVRPRATVMPDHIRVSMSCLPVDYPSTLNIMISALREPVVTSEDIEGKMSDLEFRRFGYWRTALEPQRFERTKIQQRDFQELVSSVVRPENIWISVGGKVVPGLAEDRWSTAVASWQLPRLTPRRPEIPSADNPAWAEKVNIVEFTGPEFTATDADFSTKLLALTALGTGKSGSLWRIARQNLGMSYRQEAILWPTAKGFIPRLIIATTHSSDLDAIAADLKKKLLEDVSGWKDENRQAAIGVCSNYLTRPGDLSPLYWTEGRPIGREVEDQAFVSAYWRMKSGAEWNPFNIAGRLGFIEIKDLKATAEGFIQNAKLTIRRAAG